MFPPLIFSHPESSPNKIEQTLAAARMLIPSGPAGQIRWVDSAANSPAPATHSADAQLKVCVLSLALLSMSYPCITYASSK